jgi:hypothetical protein
MLHERNRMKEFLITEIKINDYLTILKETVYPILKDDPLWHFWNELGGGLIVRCSSKFSTKLHKRLLKKGIHPEIKSWVHDQRIVEENWDYMIDMFHLNSKYAMEHTLENKYFLTEEDCWLFMDRMIHSFYNNVEMTAMKKPFYGEAYGLARILIGRATYDGMNFLEMESRGKVKDGDPSGESNSSGLQDKGERSSLENN